jgi:hypothetical protein
MASFAYSHHDMFSKSHHITLVHFSSIPTQFPLTQYLHTVPMIWMDCSIASANLNAGCLILIENSKFKWLHLPPHVFPQSYCSIHFHLDVGRWQNIQEEPTGGYGDDFLYFILVQALGNFFNLPLYSINSPYSLDLPL